MSGLEDPVVITDNDDKMSKQMDTESFSERNNSTGSHGIIGTASKYQPVRVKQLLEADDSDDDDDEVIEKNEDDGEPDPEDCQTESDLKTESFCDSNTTINSQYHKIEVITEEPERLSITKSLLKNPFEFCSSTTTESHYSRYHNENRLQEPVFPIDKQNSLTNDLFNANNDGHSTRRSSVTGFTSDFGNMEIDPMTLRPIPSRYSQTNQQQSSTKIETSDIVTTKKSDEPIKTAIKSSHDRHIHLSTSYKSEHSSQASNSMFEGPITGVKNELPPPPPASMSHSLSASHLLLDTPLKHNPPTGSLRPIPSLSHRNIFQTPQNKSSRDYTNNQSHIQTPATIFSSWSQNNSMHTPMQGRITESVHSSGQPRLPKLDNHW